jgi:glycerol-1-phosphate dehydrogenase [NAD(P)+]
LHAIDQLFPGTGNHGELAGVGALFCTYLRGDDRGCALLSACLARHGLPRTPADLGLGLAEFTKAVLHAPATRPGRYTILERLALDECAIAQRVEGFAAAVRNGG